VYAAGHRPQAGAKRTDALERAFSELAALRAREFIFLSKRKDHKQKKEKRKICKWLQQHLDRAAGREDGNAGGFGSCADWKFWFRDVGWRRKGRRTAG
jgi:hypothetical protein